jgi:CDP-glucose 4,6-dehydratase
VRRLQDLGADTAVLVRDGGTESPLVGDWIDDVRVVHGDLCTPGLAERLLGEYDVTTVFHLAAQSQVGVANRNPVSTFEANVAGTWTLLEAARRSPLVEQVVVASTDKAYGTQPSLPYTEDMPLLAVNPYDVSKACADLITGTYAHAFGLPVCTTRCGNLYGPGDLNWQRIIPGTVRSVHRGERPVLRSDGTMVRDYVFIEDAADFYLRLAERMAVDPTLHGEAFNVSLEHPISVIELVRLLLELMQSDLEPEVLGTATNEIPEQFLSSEKARDRLGWKAQHDLREGLLATIEWYRAALEAGDP